MAADTKRATCLREWEGIPESRVFATEAPSIERFTPKINHDWRAFDDFGSAILRCSGLTRMIGSDLVDVRQVLGDEADAALADTSLCLDILEEKLGELYLTFQALDSIARPSTRSAAA